MSLNIFCKLRGSGSTKRMWVRSLGTPRKGNNNHHCHLGAGCYSPGTVVTLYDLSVNEFSQQVCADAISFYSWGIWGSERLSSFLSHIAGKWQSWDLKAGLPGPKASVHPEGWRHTPNEEGRDSKQAALFLPQRSQPFSLKHSLRKGAEEAPSTCYELNCVPQIHIRSLTLSTSELIPFGDKAFKAVIEVKLGY